MEGSKRPNEGISEDNLMVNHPPAGASSKRGKTEKSGGAASEFTNAPENIVH
jgi:hypothetical protein